MSMVMGVIDVLDAELILNMVAGNYTTLEKLNAGSTYQIELLI
jgi:hypothetical protein